MGALERQSAAFRSARRAGLRLECSSLSRVAGVATPYRLRITCLLAVAAAVAVVAAGWGGAPTSKAGVQTARRLAKSATVTTRKVKKLGTVLVNSRGRTLYMFVPDHRKKVTCKGKCATYWPPLKVKKGRKPTAGGAAKKKLLGTDKNPGGGRVVTYNRWPLYTYIADTKPGQATGQAIKLNGGYWYVLSPAGKVIKKKP
jgi:predicted lipoprotein with Yx(FWY)xxD motif